ncbi:interferon beta [Dugong dugon]
MTTGCILQIALLLCFSITALSRSLNLLQFQQRSTNLECQRLMMKLSQAPESCLNDRMNFEVPKEIEQPRQFQKDDAVLVIHDMLLQIFEIFGKNLSHTGWNETIIENLRSELSDQIDRLKAILDENTEEENPTWENSMTMLGHLRNYYTRIVQYLNAESYSSCAWMVVWTEIFRNFSFISTLTDYLQN